MIAWRISKAKRSTDLSGKGAALEGGRWNDIETPAVYMGLSPAICCLETFVHASSYPNLPLTITRFILPDDEALYLKPSPSKLPTSWAAIPPGRASMAYGTQWLQQNKYLGLIVPSAVLPLENNIMLNPSHPAIKQVRVDQQFDFMYDDRMFAAKGLANPR